MAAKKKRKKTLAVKIDAATSKELVRLRKEGFAVYIDKQGRIKKFPFHG